MAALRLRAVAQALGIAVLVLPAAAAAIDWQWRGRLQTAHERFDGVHTDNGQVRDATWLRRVDVSLRGRTGPWQADMALDLNTEGDPWLELDEATLSWQSPAGWQLRAGRFDPDFGLEPSGSSSSAVGLDDSALWDLAPDAVDGSRALGLDLRHNGRHWHASGALLDQPGHHASSLRLAAWGEPDPARLWHLGLSLAQQHGWQGDGRIRSRLGVRGVSEDDAGRRVTLAPAERFDRDRAWVLETAWRAGAWSLRGEWLQRRLSGHGVPARRVRGWDWQLAHTLTGQPRGYDGEGARFGPPAAGATGVTVWEAHLRSTRLAVDGARAARLHALGLNAYIGRSWRASIALQHASLNDDVGPGLRSGRALLTRLQWRY